MIIFKAMAHFTALTTDDIFRPHISGQDFTSPNESTDVGYNL